MSYRLSISYRIPKSGVYEYDLLVPELCGTDATETDWGTLNASTRMFGYRFQDKLTLDEALSRFAEYNHIFRLSYEEEQNNGY